MSVYTINFKNINCSLDTENNIKYRIVHEKSSNNYLIWCVLVKIGYLSLLQNHTCSWLLSPLRPDSYPIAFRQHLFTLCLAVLYFIFTFPFSLITMLLLSLHIISYLYFPAVCLTTVILCDPLCSHVKESSRST